jgi:cytochrome c oxidase subunit 2
MNAKAASTIVWGLAAALHSGLGMAASADPYQLNLPEPQSIIARQIYEQHTLLLWICLVIFVGVFGTMFYSVLKHRKSQGYKAANFHHSTTVEIIWTIIPFFILVGMAYPATKTVIAMKDTSSPDIAIKTTGYQWKWGYDYITGEGEGISFFSNLATPKAQINNAASKNENYLLEVDNPLVVPVGKKVRILLTANDVIHAWWVPALGAKQDAIPGMSATPGSQLTSPALTAASVPSCAGRSTDSCPLSSKSWSHRNMPSGWPGKKNSRNTRKNSEFRKTTRGENMAAVPITILHMRTTIIPAA